MKAHRSVAIVIVCTLACSYVYSQRPRPAPNEDIKETILAIHEEILESSKSAAPTPATEAVSASFATPDVCGKTFTPQQVLTDGIRIGFGGAAHLRSGAELGTYSFYTFVRITDGKGTVIREASGQHPLTYTGTDISRDFGFMDIIKNCYCDVTTLEIETSVSSISPKGRFVVHQYDDKCQVTIKP